MLDITVIKQDGVASLVRKRDGVVTATLARLIDTPENKLFIIDTLACKSLRFKCDTPLKYDVQGTMQLAVVPDNAVIKVYKLPHYTELHYETMLANKAMLHISTSKYISAEMRDNMTLDYDGILNNLLEFIADM